MQNCLWVISLIGALGAIGAALAAWRSANETRKVVLGQIVMQITDAYSSPEMFQSIKNLYEWQSNHGKSLATEFSDGLKKGDAKANRLDEDRRRYAHHFHRIKAMLDCGVVDENFVKNLVKPGQVNTLLDVVEPLEKAKNPGYDHSTFDTFRRIYCKGS